MLRTLPNSAVAITNCRAAIVPHQRLREITIAQPGLARMLWKSTLIDASMYRQWLVCIGRQSALSRLAHLFCELYLRLAVVGLTKEMSYSFSVTQSDLSDAMGLSLVQPTGLARCSGKRVSRPSRRHGADSQLGTAAAGGGVRTGISSPRKPPPEIAPAGTLHHST